MNIQTFVKTGSNAGNKIHVVTSGHGGFSLHEDANGITFEDNDGTPPLPPRENGWTPVLVANPLETLLGICHQYFPDYVAPITVYSSEDSTDDDL